MAEIIEKWVCHTCGSNGMGTGRDHRCAVQPTRDPALRKAALNALEAWAVLREALNYFPCDPQIEQRIDKAMDSLREEVAK